MKEMIELLKYYAKKKGIKKGVTLILEDDESGCVKEYVYPSNMLFTFNNLEELVQILKS
jgi:hypothetical protein